MIVTVFIKGIKSVFLFVCFFVFVVLVVRTNLQTLSATPTTGRLSSQEKTKTYLLPTTMHQHWKIGQ